MPIWVVVLGLGVLGGLGVAGWWYLGPGRPGRGGESSLGVSDERAASADGTNRAPLRGDGTSELTISKMQSLVGVVIARAKVRWQGGEDRFLPVERGTAFTVSRDGLLVTSRHVVKPITELEPVSRGDLDILGWDIVVAFGPKPEDRYPATIVHMSTYLDLAVLRIDRRTDSCLRFAKRYAQGDDLKTFGYPGVSSELMAELNEQETLEKDRSLVKLFQGGVVPEIDDLLRASDFSVSMFKGSIGAIRSTEAGVFLQTDAKMYEGMSGGPVVNDSFEVVGVVTFRHSEVEGINMALSAESVRDDLSDIAGIKW